MFFTPEHQPTPEGIESPGRSSLIERDGDEQAVVSVRVDTPSGGKHKLYSTAGGSSRRNMFISCPEDKPAVTGCRGDGDGQRFSSICQSPCKLSINSATPATSRVAGHEKTRSASAKAGSPSL